MERNFKGVWIPKDIWINENLSIQEKVFIAEIDSLDNEQGCFASNDYFADFFKISKRRCIEILKSLEEKNFLKIQYIYKNGTKCIEKRILKLTKNVVKKTSQGGEENFTGVVKKTSQGGEENFTDNNIVYNIDYNINYINIVNMYNETCVSLPKVKLPLSENRKKTIRARLNNHDQEDLFTAFKLAEESEFLKGGNNRNWMATFDWILKDTNLPKILEGNYANRQGHINNNINNQMPKYTSDGDFI